MNRKIPNLRRNIIIILLFSAICIILFVMIFHSDKLYILEQYDTTKPCEVNGLKINSPGCYDPERIARLEYYQKIIDLATLAGIFIIIGMLIYWYRRLPPDHFLKTWVRLYNEKANDNG